MRTVHVLNVLLAAPMILAQVVNYAQDGSFESVPKKNLYLANTHAGSWTIRNNVLFATNAEQPKGYTTPYGSQFVYYTNVTTANTNAEVVQSVSNLPTKQNLTIAYSYRVFQNSNAECGFAVTFNTAVVDAFILPKGRGQWTMRRTEPFVSSSTTGAYAFSVGCGSKGKYGKFGLDEVELLYDGCPLCG